MLYILVFSCSLPSFLRLLARLYERTGRAIAVTTATASASASPSASASASTSASALLKMLMYLVKVFRSLYLLNPWMNLFDTLPDVRYWSEVLCYTITTHISDLEVKVTDFDILSEAFRSLYLLNSIS